MRLLMPVLSDNGLDSEINPHFGRSSLFAIYDTDMKELKIVKNRCMHSGGCMVVDEMLKQNPDIVFVHDMGFKATEKFKIRGVKVKTGRFKLLKEVIENINDLADLTEACRH
jgi:predicted Fe-Mo cluster-binding NifX family protein